MLTLFGGSNSYCDGVSRRSFLQVGALGVGGLTLADLFRAEARAGNKATGKAIINVFLGGGPPHLDMFDPKPDAPVEFRGEFGSIESKLAGVRVCELMPRSAAKLDQMVVIRSLVGSSNEHSGYQCNSGWAQRDLQAVGGHPSIGSVASRLIGSRDRIAPPFVDFSSEGKPGFLGPVYSAYRPDGVGSANLKLNYALTADRLNDRAQLLKELDRTRTAIDQSGSMAALDAFNQRAIDVLTSSRMADALDLSKESQRVIDRYTGGPLASDRAKLVNGHNNRFLLARRLVEAGVRVVSLNWGGWDTHTGNFKTLRAQLPQLDQGLTALHEDLTERGLFNDVLVIVWGEFGRTPRVNNQAGRDHWPPVSPALLFGGGLQMGQVLGATGRIGDYVVERPIHFQEVFATLYRQLGIDPATTLTDPNGRPQYLLDHRTPIRELV
jgi:uncharacterized protein (DUF1501 family)